MMRATVSIVVVALVILAGCSGGADSTAPSECTEVSTTGDIHDSATVTVMDTNGTTLATVDARVADSPREQCIGLSTATSLESGEGMLFVFDDTATRTFVMREMSFPLDIIFVAGNGTITQIYSAPTEEPPLTEYEGRAQYVLEVPRGWAAANGVEVGDRIRVAFEDP